MTTGREPSIGGDKRIDANGSEPKLGGEAAILHLVEMLEHPDRKVRYRAAFKLAETGDRRVFDILVEMLQDENGTRRLRERAAMALGQLGDERAIEPLLASIGMVSPYHVIKALVQIGGEQAIEAARQAAYNHWHDDRVYRAIKETLPQLGGQWACEFLVSALENEAFPGLIDACEFVTTLRQMGILDVERLLPMFNHESSHVRLNAINLLSDINDERLVEPLIALLDDDNPRVAIQAIDELVDLGSPRAIPHLIALLNHEDRSMVFRAIVGLSRLRDRRAVPPLLNIVSHPDLYPEDSFIPEIAVSALGMIGDVRAVEPLLNILDERPISGVISALGRIGDPRAVKALGKALLEGDTEHTESLAIALANIDTDEAMEILVTAVRQSRADDGYETDTPALGGTQDSQSMESRIALLMRHPASGVRRSATGMMRSLPDEHAVEALIEALGDRDEDVRRLAVFYLGPIGDARAVEPLIAALHDSCDLVRCFAARSLGEIGDVRAVEPLIQTMCNDQEIENVRWEAVIALGQLGDERAIEPLISTLYRVDQARVECRESGSDSDGQATIIYRLMFSACHTALEKIGTPEALAAIEDLSFRDLGDEP